MLFRSDFYSIDKEYYLICQTSGLIYSEIYKRIRIIIIKTKILVTIVRAKFQDHFYLRISEEIYRSH